MLRSKARSKPATSVQYHPQKGENIGEAGDVYPGDPKLSKKAKKVVDGKLPALLTV